MIENLKDLKSLLKLCRQNGVTEMTWGSVNLKLGEAPKPIAGDMEDSQEDDVMNQLETPLTPEELVAFANGAT